MATLDDAAMAALRPNTLVWQVRSLLLRRNPRPGAAASIADVAARMHTEATPLDRAILVAVCIEDVFAYIESRDGMAERHALVRPILDGIRGRRAHLMALEVAWTVSIRIPYDIGREEFASIADNMGVIVEPLVAGYLAAGGGPRASDIAWSAMQRMAQRPEDNGEGPPPAWAPPVWQEILHTPGVLYPMGGWGPYIGAPPAVVEGFGPWFTGHETAWTRIVGGVAELKAANTRASSSSSSSSPSSSSPSPAMATLDDAAIAALRPNTLVAQTRSILTRHRTSPLTSASYIDIASVAARMRTGATPADRVRIVALCVADVLEHAVTRAGGIERYALVRPILDGIHGTRAHLMALEVAWNISLGLLSHFGDDDEFAPVADNMGVIVEPLVDGYLSAGGDRRVSDIAWSAMQRMAQSPAPVAAGPPPAWTPPVWQAILRTPAALYPVDEWDMYHRAPRAVVTQINNAEDFVAGVRYTGPRYMGPWFTPHEVAWTRIVDGVVALQTASMRIASTHIAEAHLVPDLARLVESFMPFGRDWTEARMTEDDADGVAAAATARAIARTNAALRAAAPVRAAAAAAAAARMSDDDAVVAPFDAASAGDKRHRRIDAEEKNEDDDDDDDDDGDGEERKEGDARKKAKTRARMRR